MNYSKTEHRKAFPIQTHNSTATRRAEPYLELELKL